MRILMLNFEFPPLGGGAANATAFLLEELKLHPELEIDLITSSTKGFRVENWAKNIRIHFLDINKSDKLHLQSSKELLVYSYKAHRYTKEMIKAQPYDLIHCFFGIPCGLIASFFRIPYIVSLRGSDVPFHNKKFYWLDRLLFARLNRNRIWKKAYNVVANSAGLAEEVALTSKSQKVDIIANGVDTQMFRPKNKTNNQFEIISVSRITKHKGYLFLFEALRQMQNYKCTLVGDGPDIDFFKALATEMKLNVHFTGRMEKQNVAEYLQNSDVFVLPSLNEGMSNAVMEALATGLPIVMTNVGGAKELIHDNGIIVKKENTQAILAALRRYQTNAELRLRHGINSRNIAEQMSWGATAKQYLTLYKHIKFELSCAE